MKIYITEYNHFKGACFQEAVVRIVPTHGSYYFIQVLDELDSQRIEKNIDNIVGPEKHDHVPCVYDAMIEAVHNNVDPEANFCHDRVFVLSVDYSAQAIHFGNRTLRVTNGCKEYPKLIRDDFHQIKYQNAEHHGLAQPGLVVCALRAPEGSRIAFSYARVFEFGVFSRLTLEAFSIIRVGCQAKDYGNACLDEHRYKREDPVSPKKTHVSVYADILLKVIEPVIGYFVEKFEWLDDEI
mmetsp:Transcript_37619/g.84060  ORF Transcript_37619/g.84060 Transcript_37619/m.84060 type:complete len:239 (-) Transcript_37619:303-1019(-)